MHPALALAGFGIGCAMAALGWWRRRAEPGTGQGALVGVLALAVVVALLVAGQVPALAAVPLLVLPVLARFAGGHVAPNLRVWSIDGFAAALAATAVLAAVLPDTEGPVVLGAALVPMAAVALVAPITWRGADALTGATALATVVVLVAIDACGGRGGALAVALVAAMVCAALTVLATNLLLGDRLAAGGSRATRGHRTITSGRAHPSR